MEHIVKITKNDLDLLKNFSEINPSIIFAEGNIQSVRSSGRHMIVTAGFEMTFPKEFVLYDLNKFIQIHQLVETTGDTEVVVEDTQILIRSDAAIQHINAASKELIVEGVRTEPTSEPDISFNIKEVDLQYCKKSAAINGFEDITFECDGEAIYVVTTSIENPKSETHRRFICNFNKKFKMELKIEYMKMLPDDYEVLLYKKSRVRFKSTNRDYSFYVGLSSQAEIEEC